MTVLNRRNRLISFRVSEDEFDRYTRLCEAEGARSISDLARTAVNRMLLMSEAVSPDAPRGIQTLDEVTRSLHANLALISGLLREYNAMPVAPPPPQEEHEKK